MFYGKNKAFRKFIVGIDKRKMDAIIYVNRTTCYNIRFSWIFELKHGRDFNAFARQYLKINAKIQNPRRQADAAEKELESMSKSIQQKGGVHYGGRGQER